MVTMAEWLFTDDPNARFLIPVKDISLNEPSLGNHPTKKAVKDWLDVIGIKCYNSILRQRLTTLREVYEKAPFDNLIDTKYGEHQMVVEIWDGHQREEIGQATPISFFWVNRYNNQQTQYFNIFDDLYKYVDRERENMFPIYVVIERDGEIVLMEGRHRWMCAYLLGLEKIPCTIQKRNWSYEPDFDRKIQKIREARIIPSV